MFGTFALHGQYGKSIVSGLLYQNAENTEQTYRTLQSHEQLLHYEIAHCFRIVVVTAYIKPLTIENKGGLFSPAPLPDLKS